MFITEEQLELYQSQENHRYYKMPMCNIVLKEFHALMHNVNYKHNNILSLFEYFLHQKVSQNVWKYYFKDDSVLIVEEIQDDSGKMYNFSFFYGFDE